jgi:hypothetical protein
VKATTVMFIAVGASVIGAWANNKKITVPKVVEGMFAVLVIAMLDGGKTEDVAKGFAWLFLVAVLLGQDSPLNGIVKAAGLKPAAATGISEGVQVL